MHPIVMNFRLSSVTLKTFCNIVPQTYRFGRIFHRGKVKVGRKVTISNVSAKYNVPTPSYNLMANFEMQLKSYGQLAYKRTST